MQFGKDPVTFMTEIYLTDEEAEQFKEMVRGASLPHRRMFNKALTRI